MPLEGLITFVRLLIHIAENEIQIGIRPLGAAYMRRYAISRSDI